jgi:large subunit ribosomal protein L29
VSTPTELREKTPQELGQLIDDTRRELLDLRFRNASGELENTAGLREARRNLARALTIARERALGEPVAEAPAGETPEETGSEEQ